MPAPIERIRVAPRSVIAAVAVLGLTLLGLRILESAGRVIGWVFIAVAAAALIAPAVGVLDRHIPRPLALVAVAVSLFAIVGAVSYGVVDDLVAQLQTLQREAPQRAADLEASGRFADVATEAHLADRTRAFVDSVPARLRGGTPAEALRAGATRGVAFLAVSVLTLFFVLHGEHIERGAFRQIHDDDQRERVEHIVVAAYRRSVGYAHGVVLMAGIAGLTAYGVARVASVPGPAPLGLWVALWDVVPVIGAFVGALPIVALAAVVDPARGVIVALAFVGYQVFEQLVLQRRVERDTVRVGPFLTAAAGLTGVELYGIAGALLGILAVAVATAVVDEVAASRD